MFTYVHYSTPWRFGSAEFIIMHLNGTVTCSLCTHTACARTQPCADCAGYGSSWGLKAVTMWL